MYYEVANRVVVAGANTIVYSQAVNMGGANAVMISATVFNITGGTVEVTSEQSNDLENWGTLSGQVDFTAGTYNTPNISQVGAAHDITVLNRPPPRE